MKTLPQKPPTRRARTVVKREPAIRWTLNLAAREFGVHREHLERRRRVLGIEPGKDGHFTSQELARMLFGDKEAETIAEIVERRKKLERENREADGELVAVERVCILGERYVAAVRQVILNSSLSETEKQEALSEIVQLGETDWTAEAKATAKEKR